MAGGIEYVVKTDLDPASVTAIGLEIFKLWAEFAQGSSTVGGQRIMHPTGRYAASISFEQTGEATVAIIADETEAPEAAILETGHKAVDMKMKKGNLRPDGRGGRTFHASMWAYPSKRFEGGGGPEFATVAQPGAPGWVIPPMPAYAPGHVFAKMAAAMARGGF